MARQHVFGEQHQLAVGVDDLAILGDDAQAVAVAVEGQADFRRTIAQGADQVLQVFRMGRIGVVIGEVAVDFAEQLFDFAAHAAIECAGKGAGHAVAAIDGDFHRARELDVADDAREIGFADIVRPVAAIAVCGVFGQDGFVQRLDGVAVDRLSGQHHLEAIVVGRIVAAGDHDAGLGVQHVGAEIHHGRGDDAEVDHVDAGVLQTLRQGAGQFGAGEPAILADDDSAFALPDDGAAESVADLARDRCVERLADDAADVVGLEDTLSESHSDVMKK